MVLGRVIGTLVASHKQPSMDGLTLLVVESCDVDGAPTGATVIAADAVGAGVGEVVLYAAGSSARQTELTNHKPIDATIMAIVDQVTVAGELRFRKDG